MSEEAFFFFFFKDLFKVRLLDLRYTKGNTPTLTKELQKKIICITVLIKREKCQVHCLNTEGRACCVIRLLTPLIQLAIVFCRVVFQCLSRAVGELVCSADLHMSCFRAE